MRSASVMKTYVHTTPKNQAAVIMRYLAERFEKRNKNGISWFKVIQVTIYLLDDQSRIWFWRNDDIRHWFFKANALMELMQSRNLGYLAVSLGFYKTLFSAPGTSTSSEIL
jgi:methionine-gamma-lyase